MLRKAEIQTSKNKSSFCIEYGSAYPKVYIKYGKFYITGSTVLHTARVTIKGKKKQ